MLKTIDDFITLERRGFTPRKQWETLLNSPVLLQELGNNPENITQYIQGWDKKLKFIELTKSESYNILIVELSYQLLEQNATELSEGSQNVLYEHEFFSWLTETVQKFKDEVGLILLDTKNLSYMSPSMLVFLSNFSKARRSEKLSVLLTEQPTRFSPIPPQNFTRESPERLPTEIGLLITELENLLYSENDTVRQSSLDLGFQEQVLFIGPLCNILRSTYFLDKYEISYQIKYHVSLR